MFVQESGDGTLRTATFGELYESGLRWAGALRRLGVEPGDRVVTMLPTNIGAVECWMGIAWLRAMDTGIHQGYHGTLLLRLLEAVDPGAIVIADSEIHRLQEVISALPNCRKVVVVGEAELDCPPTTEVHSLDEAMDGVALARDLTAPERQDIACIVFTSGTTGPSKPVLVPWGNYMATLAVWSDLTQDDAFYSPYPLCHSAGRSPFTWMGVLGGRWIIRDSFKLDRFWSDIEQFGCTTTQVIAAMMEWLVEQPERPGESASTLRNMVSAPVSERVFEFQERFGVGVRTVYGQSEVGMILSRIPKIVGEFKSCGRATPGFEVKLVDENDYEVPLGEVGEAVVRADTPWSLNCGYWGMPTETAIAWRNGWFHTGDGMRQTEDGSFIFVDRLKDALRFRGENISSYELECVVVEHPDVLECAVIGIPAGEDEEEIKVVVVLTEEGTVAARELVEFVSAKVPSFMVPRFVEFVAALPRTEVTGRIQKNALRTVGVNEATWDRQRQLQLEGRE